MFENILKDINKMIISKTSDEIINNEIEIMKLIDPVKAINYEGDLYNLIYNLKHQFEYLPDVRNFDVDLAVYNFEKEIMKDTTVLTQYYQDDKIDEVKKLFIKDIEMTLLSASPDDYKIQEQVFGYLNEIQDPNAKNMAIKEVNNALSPDNTNMIWFHNIINTNDKFRNTYINLENDIKNAELELNKDFGVVQLPEIQENGELVPTI